MDCVASDADAYCGANIEGEKLAILCGESFMEIALETEPITELVEEAFNSVVRECTSRHESGEFTTWSAKARCINDGLDGVMRRYQMFFNMGGFWRLANKRLEVAERLDAGTISESEADKLWEHYRKVCWELPVPPECKVR